MKQKSRFKFLSWPEPSLTVYAANVTTRLPNTLSSSQIKLTKID